MKLMKIQKIKENILTDLVMNLGKEMLNQNLPDSTEILGLITLGEFKTIFKEEN